MRPFICGLTLLLSLSVQAQTHITVRVLDPENKPIAGARVSGIVAGEGATSRPQQITGPDGTAGFDIPTNKDGIPAGRFSIVAKGFAFANWRANSEDHDIHLEKGATWKGKVVDGAGKPISGAMVTVAGALKIGDWENARSLYGADNNAAYTVETGANGLFSIADVPADIPSSFEWLSPITS